MGEPPLPRDEFPVAASHCYLNHAADGPLSRSAARAVTEVTTAVLGEAGVAYERYDRHAEQVRASAARLLGTPADDVAFVKNTTEGLAFVAAGLDWRPGDRVLVARHEFPSNLYPWLALRDRGVAVELLEPEEPSGAVPLDAVAAALERGGARLVATSWVQYAAGWRTDLAALSALSHQQGALLCVDAVQGVGCLPTELATWGVDVAAASAFKWLLAPKGVGLLYVSPACREQLRPVEPGWNAVRTRGDYDETELHLDPTARRYEGGSLDVAAVAGLGAAIDLLVAAGPEKVWAHIDALTCVAGQGLEERGARILSDRSVDGRSGILTFVVDDVPADEVRARLAERGVVVAARGGGVRISPHAYNTVEDVERFLGALAEVAPAPVRQRPAPASPSQGPLRRPTDW